MKTIATFTANATESVGGLNGNYAIGMVASDGSAADLGGGTIQFKFKDENDDYLPDNATDWSFTAAPEYPQSFGFPAEQPFDVVLSGATSPDVVVKVAKYYG